LPSDLLGRGDGSEIGDDLALATLEGQCSILGDLVPTGPRVVISGQAARRFTGLGRQIEKSMAAIDGEIFQGAYLAPLNREQRDLPDPEDRRRLSRPAAEH